MQVKVSRKSGLVLEAGVNEPALGKSTCPCTNHTDENDDADDENNNKHNGNKDGDQHCSKTTSNGYATTYGCGANGA